MFFIFACIVLLAISAFAQEHNQSVKDVVTNEYNLQEAIEIALRSSPVLAAFALELDAADARYKQARLWENPIFDAETENFSGDNPGFSRTENTFWITQPFLMGGKRDHLKEIAQKDKEILLLEYEAKRRDLILAVEEVIYDILLAQKNVEFVQEAQAIAKELYNFKTKGMNQENYSSDKLLSMEIELSQAELELLNANKDLKIAKKNLAQLWGMTKIFFGECQGSLEREFTMPECDELKKCLLERNPAIKINKLREERGNYLLQHAKSERIPDVDLSFGVREFNEDDDYTFVGAISIPLPLFNRNQGGIQEALVNQKKIEVEDSATKNSLLLELNENYRTFQILKQQVDVIRNTILPKAEKYLLQTRDGFQKKRKDYLELLESRRKLIEIQKSYLETLKELHCSIAHLERLCFTHCHGADGEVF